MDNLNPEDDHMVEWNKIELTVFVACCIGVGALVVGVIALVHYLIT